MTKDRSINPATAVANKPPNRTRTDRDSEAPNHRGNLGPAVPQTPRISVTGIERDVTLYPAHPVAPDFSRVKATDYVAAQFADDAAKLNH